MERCKNFETSAKIESFCQINATDINFGVVSLPLTAQSANSQMNVLCSNNTPYKVDLEYGGNYVGKSSTGTSGIEGVTVSMAYKRTDAYEASSGYKSSGYSLYKNGIPIGDGYQLKRETDSQYEFNLNGDDNWGDFICYSQNPSQIYFRTLEAAQLVQGTSVIGQYVTDINGICNYSTGRLNESNFTKLFGSGKLADKGLMNGTFKGDKLAYQITLPTDSTKPWIAGVNSYTSSGVGSNQTIEVNDKIMPSASSSSYIAADTYLDTIIAIITY